MHAADKNHDLVLKITGGEPLAGDLCVSGSKNAALPEMAAALLTKEPVHLKNVPRVTDTRVMAQVLESIGAKCDGEGAINIDASGASTPRVSDELGRRMRAMRDDALAAGSSGAEIGVLRMIAFVLASVYGGVAGVLLTTPLLTTVTGTLPVCGSSGASTPI